MNLRPARYLLRVDDLCPTVKREPWRKLSALIDEFGLRPILAVVPDNRDPGLRLSEPDECFWSQMRTMQEAGALIALHGYQHLATNLGRSIVPLHRESEFAGMPLSTQRAWIQAGLAILSLQGLRPAVWVAPRHGFDSNTLQALREVGVSLLSDGFAQRPFLRGGLTWVPQQLWEPAEKTTGVWTICLHTNTMTAQQFNQFAGFVRKNAARFATVHEALAEFPPSRLTFQEWLCEQILYARYRASRFKRAIVHRLHREQVQGGALPPLPLP